jgi:hypothetical protein
MADFDFEIHHIEVGAPIYNVLSTDMEGYHRKTRLISSSPKRTWKIFIRLRTLAERNLILAHYNSMYGNLTSFNWTSIPTYIGFESASVSVYYVSYKETLVGTLWDIEIDFQEAL